MLQCKFCCAVQVSGLAISAGNAYLAYITGNEPHGFRWLRDQSRSRLFLQESAIDVARRDHFVTHPNQLLAAVSAADFALLRPHLKTIELVHEVVLFEAGDPVKRVYFPTVE